MFQRLTQRVLEPPAFGLDISDLTIKYCRVVARDGAIALDYFGEIEIPEGIVVGGEIRKTEELRRIVSEDLRTSDGKKIHEHFCVASLPEEKSFVRVVDMPNIATDDISKAIRWEVEGVIPLPIDQIIFDYEFVAASRAVAREPRAASTIVGESGSRPGASGLMSGRRDVLLTAFPQDIVESYHRVLLAAGFFPIAIELESQAISRALIHDAASQTPVIIVDIGATRTSFIMFAGGSIFFTKSITVGGHDFEVAIAEKLGVPIAEARQAKIAAGLNKNYRDGRVFEALYPHLAMIADEIDQQLSFYRSHPAKHEGTLGDIERVILCGGDANLIGLERYIATTVKKETVLGNPFVNFQFPLGTIPAIPKNKSLKYTTAIGLALRAVGH